MPKYQNFEKKSYLRVLQKRIATKHTHVTGCFSARKPEIDRLTLRDHKV